MAGARTVTVDEEARAVPLALARLHRQLADDEPIAVRIVHRPPSPVSIADLVSGAGFALRDTSGTTLLLTRQRTLPDTVGPAMAMLVCGLNPSLHAADAGVGYAGPGNRFWPAMRAAGLAPRHEPGPSDPIRLLTERGVGMTDMVKRATPRAGELTVDEHRTGLGRLERLVAWLQPGVVCIVGLAGWRAAVDRRAVAGPSDRLLGGRPVHLMPSTSGLNARSSLDELTDHLRDAATLTDPDL